MTKAIQTVIPGDFSVNFANKKGDVCTVSLEGALFKGGAALTALKDTAMASALTKAQSGRYGPAGDILEASFPTIGKAVRALHGIPTLNAENFRALLSGIERAPEGKKGFSKKQETAKLLVRALREVKALSPAKDNNTITVDSRELVEV
jgi:hypothetical protein